MSKYAVDLVVPNTTSEEARYGNGGFAPFHFSVEVDAKSYDDAAEQALAFARESMKHFRITAI